MSSKSNNQRSSRSSRPKQAPPKKELEPPKLIMLKYGRENNFPAWKESMRNEVAIEFGLLVSIIDEGEVLHPAEVNVDDYDAGEDPHGFELHALRSRLTERQKTITKMELMMPKMRAMIWKHLSRESMEAVLRHADYDEEEHRNDPHQLYLSILATHSIGGEAQGEVGRRAATRQAYKSLSQGPFESIAEFKLRFTHGKEAYDQSGNVEMPEEDVAMDFLSGLDNGRYSRFKVEIDNDSAKGEQPPATLHDMFLRASTFKVEKSSYRPHGGAAFATRADEAEQPRNPSTIDKAKKGRDKSGGEGKAQPGSAGGSKPRSERDMSKVTCFNCNELGHMSYNCPNEAGFDGVEHGTACATFGSFEAVPLLRDDDECLRIRTLLDQMSEDEDSDGGERTTEEAEASTVCVGRKSEPNAGKVCATMRPKLEYYEVLLDNQADISVVHPRLLTNLRDQKSYVSGLSGTTVLPQTGDLAGFFECKSSADLIASVLCQADVEDRYSITYDQGESYTVHMGTRDLVFNRRDKLYVADMREWAAAAENQSYAMVTTVADNESRFTAQEVKRARQAQELIENAGFSSEKEAVDLVSNGNLTGVPVTARDVRRAYEIYGKPVAGVRGRRTAHKARTQGVENGLKSERGEAQVMYGDVAYFRRKPFLMCLTKPLGLVTSTAVTSIATRPSHSRRRYTPT